MGGLITKGKADGAPAASSLYTPGPAGAAADGLRGDAVSSDGLLNLENRQLTNDALAKIAAMQHITRAVVSLSLANNRVTALVFDEAGVVAVSPPPCVTAPPNSGGGADSSATQHVSSTLPPYSASGSSLLPSLSSFAGSTADDDDADPETSVSGRASVSASVGPRPPLMRAVNWPLLENLDLSGNTDLFSYAGLAHVSASLKSLRLANNAIFKVPREVWGLSCLTKLDLSHNRLQVLPPAIGLLTQLNSLKLAHNSLAAAAIPEQLRHCHRLRRLDLSHNKLRELPVNYRVDRDRQSSQRRQSVSATQPGGSLLAAPGPSPRLTAIRPVATSTSAAGAPPPLLPPRPSNVSVVALKGGAAFGAVSADAVPLSLPPVTSSASDVRTPVSRGGSLYSTSGALGSSPAAGPSQAHQPPPPIRYFDPARVSYIGITILNLSNNQLDSLSPSIGLLRSLNSLNLGYNKLRSLPTEVALLSELKYLDLRFNSLPSLLAEICALPRLSKLCLQNNRISALPWEVRRLSKLTHLFVSSNQLVDLPDSIAEMRNCRVLKLCNNKLLTVADAVFRMQKLRLLDLSFNKLTFISPDVCSMPLIEDLRLWGNKLTDIPAPLLYSDVKKIIAYLRATERERFMIATQMRCMQGPRSYSRLSVRSTNEAMASRNGRAYSATRPASVDERNHRFAPLGFYNEDEDRGVSRVGAASAGGPSTLRGRSSAGPRADSGSDNDDMHSDDEFTSMFRAGASRTGSWTASDAGSRAGSAASSRRSTAARPAGSPTTAQLSSSPRDGGVMLSNTTIVQPFSNAHPFPQLSAAASPGSPGRLKRIDARDEDDDDEDDEDVDARRASMQPARRTLSATSDAVSADVLTDVIRRDWRPVPAGSAPVADAAAASALSAGAQAELMQEWDAQSKAIESQQTAVKGKTRR